MMEGPAFFWCDGRRNYVVIGVHDDESVDCYAVGVLMGRPYRLAFTSTSVADAHRRIVDELRAQTKLNITTEELP